MVQAQIRCQKQWQYYNDNNNNNNNKQQTTRKGYPHSMMILAYLRMKFSSLKIKSERVFCDAMPGILMSAAFLLVDPNPPSDSPSPSSRPKESAWNVAILGEENKSKKGNGDWMQSCNLTDINRMWNINDYSYSRLRARTHTHRISYTRMQAYTNSHVRTHTQKYLST